MTSSTPVPDGMLPVLAPNCALPNGVHVCTTQRLGGVSQTPYQSLNLGLHVGDSPAAVTQNRDFLSASLKLPGTPVWLNQTHGTHVCVSDAPNASDSYDASWTDQRGRVLAVLTADCLPVVFGSQNGQEIAVAHAGWRGLAAGVLQNTVSQFSVPPAEIWAWMGPAIGPNCFEVGPEVGDCFKQRLGDSPAVESAFIAAHSGDQDTGKWFADLYQLATIALREVGVVAVHGGGLCTYSDADNYFSYRRDGKQSGRMATLIWRD